MGEEEGIRELCQFGEGGMRWRRYVLSRSSGFCVLGSRSFLLHYESGPLVVLPSTLLPVYWDKISVYGLVLGTILSFIGVS